MIRTVAERLDHVQIGGQVGIQLASCVTGTRQGTIDVHVHVNVDAVCAHISYFRGERRRELALHKDIPALDISAVEIHGGRGSYACARCVGAGRRGSRRRKDSSLDVRIDSRGNAGSQRSLRHSRCGVEIVVVGRVVLVHYDREIIPLVAVVVRVYRDTVPGAEDGLLGQAVGGPDTRREALPTDRGAGITGGTALAANQDIMGSEIITRRAIPVVGIKRIILPAQAIVESELTGDLPLVARVEGVIRKTEGVGVIDLGDFAQPEWVTQQELRPGIGGHAVGVGDDATGAQILSIHLVAQGSQVTVEPESPARCAEGSALRLEVVQSVMVILESKAQVVRPLHFTEIDGGSVLVIPEEEGAAGTRIAHVRYPCDLEPRNTVVVRAGAIRAGNIQNSQAILALILIAVGPDVLPCLADTAEQKHAR